VTGGSSAGGSAANLAANDNSLFQAPSGLSNRTAWYATFTSLPAAPTSLKVTYDGRSPRTCTQQVAIFDWADNAWRTLDSRSVGASDVLIANLAPAAPLSQYVSQGQARVQVTCQASAGFYTSAGDRLTVDFVA